MTKSFRTIEISNASYSPENIRFVTVKSKALKGRADVTFFIPSHIKRLTKKIPVVILLHGVYGSHWAWTYNINVHGTAMGLMEKNEIGPMVLVMPSDGLMGDGSGYFKHGDKDFEAWIVKDVVGLIPEVLPFSGAKPNLYIAGLSMGGYGALRLMAKYPSLFHGASGLSSITSQNDLLPFLAPDERRYYKSAFGEEALIDYMVRNRKRLPRFRFDCGKSDSLLKSNRILHEKLIHERIPHEYQEFEGGHDNEYWNKNIGATLRYFSVLNTMLIH
jgi:enterochelin esterase-like enzyme